MSKLNTALMNAPINPKDQSVFRIGWNAALEAVLSDDTYYEALDASPSAFATVERAVEYVR